MAYTQNEWAVKDNGEYLEVRGIDVLKPNILIFPFNPVGCDPKDYCDEDEALANAKLVAAAPDLLEALIKCIDVVKQWHGEEGFDIYLNHSPEMKPIRDAIKKANE